MTQAEYTSRNGAERNDGNAMTEFAFCVWVYTGLAPIGAKTTINLLHPQAGSAITWSDRKTVANVKGCSCA